MRTKVIATLVVIVVLFCDGTSSEPNPQNPCSDIFEYATDEQGTFGKITLKDISYGSTKVQIEMTQTGILNQEYSGKLSLNIDKDRVFDYIKSGTPITYRVDFPLKNVVPRVTGITVNNVKKCSGPEDPPPRTTVKLEHTLSVSSGQPELQSSNQPSKIPNIRGPSNWPFINRSADLKSFPFDAMLFPRPKFNTPNTDSSVTKSNPFLHNGFLIRSQFGPINPPPITVPAKITQTNSINQKNPFLNNEFLIRSQFGARIPPATEATKIVGTRPSTTSYIDSICGQENNNFSITKMAVMGKAIHRSQFPWIVAVYTRNASTLSFHCGGSLISARTVVSAAHCFQQGMEVIKIENLLLSMGRHSLTDWDNAVNLGVQQLIRHPDYRPEVDNFDADLAIVQLKESVTFSPAIRPVCLWQGPTDVRVIEGSNGIVVGWGEDETHTGVVSIPKLVNATIVSELTCIRSNEKFYYLTSNRTLCAGNRDGSGPCMGDSGSGLMVRIRNKWMLRGTVSASLSSRAQLCNLEEYVVYSDIAKFIDWIKSNMLL